MAYRFRSRAYARAGVGAAAAMVAFASAALPWRGVAAAPLPDAQKEIVYSVVDQDLRGVLAGIGGELGLDTVISSEVHGNVHGRLPPAPAEEMLDRLGAIYGFDWYCDGRTLFITAEDQAVAQILPLGPVSAGTLASALGTLGIADARFPLRAAPTGGVVLVDGPPRYVALVDQTLSALAGEVKAGPVEVRIFRGSVAGR